MSVVLPMCGLGTRWREKLASGNGSRKKRLSTFSGGNMSSFPGELWVGIGLILLVILLLMSFLANLYRKAGPNEAIVVYGMGGTRVVKGHGTLVFPMVQNWRQLSLELMSFDVAPQQDLYTKQGVAVTVEAVAQIKVKSDDESVRT